MKYFYIFVVFLIACCDVTKLGHAYRVTFSDALPIQFWLADCDTYNEKEVCGIHHKCFCQPWNCEDEIIIQFSDSTVSDYVLRVLNSDNEPIEEVEFTATEFLSDAFSGLPFSGWVNIPVGDGFSWSPTPAVTISAGGGFPDSKDSDLLSTPITVLPGTYSLSYNLTTSGGGFPVIYFRFKKNGVSVGSASYVPISTGSHIGSVNVTITDVADEFTVSISTLSVSGCTLILDSMFSMESTIRDPIYTANYTPSEGSPSVCNERISFQIVEVGTSPESIVGKSDCIDIRNSHDCTILIEYTNNRNFAGLVYENVTPATTFKILAPAIFFHERFPEEDNVIELTNSIIKTSGQLKSQRLFETDYLPYYMHKKLKLVLKHQTVLIDNIYWTKEESYDIQDGERRWPVKKGKCFLTEKDYVQRAVL